MTPDAREQARHNASVMIAFAEGKEIEVSFGHDHWMACKSPSWDWRACQFRVKPEERKAIEVTIWFNRDGSPYSTEVGFSSEIVPLKTLRHFREVLPWENTGENTPS